MRACRVSSTVIFAAALSACTAPAPAAEDPDFESAEYRAEREAMRREVAPIRAALIRDLYHRWDELAAARAGIPPKDHAWWRENIEWLRPRLGACGAPEAIDAHATASHGRFRYPCENGALELEIWIDYGLVDRVRFGGRGIEAPEPVRAAAEEVVAAMPLGDVELDRWPAGDDFISDFAVGLGRCEIRGTDITGVRGGLFYLECEGGDAHFKVGLDHRDGLPRVLRLWPPQDERHRYRGRFGV